LTKAPHCAEFAAVFTLIFAGQVSGQGSVTVTLKAQVAVLPDPSVAVQLTLVVPTGNSDPDAGAHTNVEPGQLSVTTGGG
jgi:hypothetical protein